MTTHVTVPTTRVPADAEERKRSSLLALLGWMVFVVLLLYVVMFGGGYWGIQAVPLRLLSLSLIGIALAGWAVVAWKVPAWRPSTSIWPALVLPLASLGLSTVVSPFPRLGIEYLAWSVLLIALYLLLARILATGFARARIGGLAAILGAVIGLVYIWIVVGRWGDWWELLGRFEVPPLRPGYAGLTFGGPNHVATAVILLAVIAFAGLGLGTRGRRFALLALSLIVAIVVVMSGSRSAWLALAGSIAVVGGLWLLANHRIIAQRLGDRRTWVALGGAAVALLIGAVAFGPVILDRLINSGDGGRPSYFASALRMFEDAPVLGLGPGTWAARRVAFLEPGDLDYSVPHAHSAYLQTLAELGVVGLLAGAVAVVTLLWLVYRALRSGDRWRRAWAWAALFGMTYLGLVSVVDFYSNLPGMLVLLAIPIAVLDVTSDRSIAVPGALRTARAGRVAVMMFMLGSIGSFAILVWAESSASTYARATEAANSQEWQEAERSASEAIAADPAQPAHHLTRALAAMHLEDWNTAIEAYGESVAVDDLPQAWLGLAVASLESGADDDVVVRHLERAMRVGYQHPAVAYGVAEVYDRIEHTTEADAAYVHALTARPTLAADPAWLADVALAARFPGLLDAAIAGSGSGGWQLALVAGDPDRARTIAAPLADAALIGDIIDAWSGDSAAALRVADRAEADPLEAGLLSTAGLLSARAGDAAAADRFRRLAAATTEGPAILSFEVRTVAPDEPGTRVPVSADLHGQLAYRRATPVDLMPPGLRRMVIYDPSKDAASL